MTKAYVKYSDATLDEYGQRALVFIRTYVDEHGWPPTSREITEALGRSSSSMGQAVLDRLEETGLIERSGGPRCIRIVNNVAQTETM